MCSRKLLLAVAVVVLAGGGWVAWFLWSRDTAEPAVTVTILRPTELSVLGDAAFGDHPAPPGAFQSLVPPPPITDGANPLVHGTARARLTNRTTAPLTLRLLPPTLFAFVPKPRAGIVRTDLRYEPGVPTSFVKPGTLSFFPETVADHAGTFRQLETKTLLPGESVEEPFAILGMITGGGPKPGVYTVRAVFEYLSADGEVKSVTSDPVTVEITADHIARWRRWLASGGP